MITWFLKKHSFTTVQEVGGRSVIYVIDTLYTVVLMFEICLPTTPHT